MLSAEEFYEAFSRAGFLKLASWEPSNGEPAQTAEVRFRAPTREVLGGAQLSTDFMIEYPASRLTGLKRGEMLTIEGVDYQVRRDQHQQLDGTVHRTYLQMVRG